MHSSDSRSIFWFLCLNLTYMLVQLFYGVWANSLGLISDAIHMFFDCVGLGIGLVAAVWSKMPGNKRYSYGWSRIEILSAFTNGLILLFISVSIVVEAVQRLIMPFDMNTDRLLIVSAVGLLVNLIGIFAFHHGHNHGHASCVDDHHHHHHHNSNMQGVFLHILADTMGSVGVIVSTLLINQFGWTGFDPIASLVTAALIVLSVLPLLKSSMLTLLQTLPKEARSRVRDAVDEIKRLPHVKFVESRIWALSEDECSLHGSLLVSYSVDDSGSEADSDITLIRSSTLAIVERCFPSTKSVFVQFKGIP